MTTLPRQRGLTEQAADAAIDTACRLLRLPSIRNEFNEIADRAVKDQMTYRGFLAELLMTECDDRARRRRNDGSKQPASRGKSPCAYLGFVCACLERQSAWGSLVLVVVGVALSGVARQRR